ncbi:hypothetical protein BDZ91DRAFT_401742 [Kalaharituber pfeilii]|nr:hypothetical protein BDZ91DRAFT_401742 [Kalaharituber pfeilii]
MCRGRKVVLGCGTPRPCPSLLASGTRTLCCIHSCLALCLARKLSASRPIEGRLALLGLVCCPWPQQATSRTSRAAPLQRHALAIIIVPLQPPPPPKRRCLQPPASKPPSSPPASFTHTAAHHSRLPYTVRPSQTEGQRKRNREKGKKKKKGNKKNEHYPRCLSPPPPPHIFFLDPASASLQHLLPASR